jgi:hypothetical protein
VACLLGPSGVRCTARVPAPTRRYQRSPPPLAWALSSAIGHLARAIQQDREGACGEPWQV